MICFARLKYGSAGEVNIICLIKLFDESLRVRTCRMIRGRESRYIFLEYMRYSRLQKLLSAKFSSYTMKSWKKVIEHELRCSLMRDLLWKPCNCLKDLCRSIIQETKSAYGFYWFRKSLQLGAQKSFNDGCYREGISF